MNAPHRLLLLVFIGSFLVAAMLLTDYTNRPHAYAEGLMTVLNAIFLPSALGLALVSGGHGDRPFWLTVTAMAASQAIATTLAFWILWALTRAYRRSSRKR